VLAKLNRRNVFILYGRGGRLVPRKARVVWRSEKADLALLHIPATPNYYRWTPTEKWLPLGTRVIHGGIATGFSSAPGKTRHPLAPESALHRQPHLQDRHPLQPGDSGGPVVDAYGNLVGINSAVEFLVPMETAFFVDSEGSRPNTRVLMDIIRRDRERNNAAPVMVN
jgi:hypothetical protein